MYAPACSSASGSPPSSPASSSAARRSASPVRAARNSAATCRSSTGTSTRLAGRPDLVPAGDQHPPRPGRRHERRHRGPARRVIEHQQPRRRAGGQHRVHRGHRVPALGGAELGGQLAEPGRQHRRILGGQLPAHPHPGQLPVRVLQRHAGLARTAQPAQRHHPRPGAVLAGQPGLQPGQQLLPPGQEHRPRRQPQRPARRHRPGPLLALRQLVQRALDPGAQPLDQALQVAELRRAHRPGHLIAEPEHQRRPGRILQIRQAHVGIAGAQQRHPRMPHCPARRNSSCVIDRPSGLPRGLEPVPVPQRSARTGHTRRHRPGSCPARCRCRAGNCRPPDAGPAAASPAPPAVPRSGRRSWTTHRPWPTPPPSRPRSVTQPSHAAARPATQTSQQ